VRMGWPKLHIRDQEQSDNRVSTHRSN
jgi:hypothetical protein